jgi:hypothetical protein
VELPVHPVQRARRLGIGHRRAHALAAAHALKPKPAHQTLHRAARHRHTLAPQLPPDLVGAVDAQVLIEHPLHLRHQDCVALGTCRQQRQLAHTGGMTSVRRRGDLQRAADRLDPVSKPVLVDEGVHFL